MATRKKNTKTTRDRAANIAARLIKSPNREVQIVAASALSQSDPNPDRHPRRRRSERTAEESADTEFKAGKDL